MPALSQSGPAVSELAAATALAVLGVGAVPNDSLGTFNLLSASGDETDFFSTQVGGGGQLTGENPIYLEAYLGLQQYNPRRFLPQFGDEALDVRWSSATVTGGVGWDFDLPAGWTFRPVAHVSLGYVFSDAILPEGVLPVSRSSFEEAVQGGLLSGGVGASVGLLQKREIGAWDVDVRFRHTHLELFPLAGDGAGSARANAIKSSAFARFKRDLTGTRVWGRPVKSVWDASVAYYWDDQADVLGTDWLATVGAGLEVETVGLDLPYVSAVRVMISYVFGDGYDGFSLGLSASF